MNRNQFNKSVVPGLFALAATSYRPKNTEATWKKFCNTKPSKRAYEESAYFGAFGTIPAKPEGVGISYDEAVQGPTKRWTHKTYGLGVRTTEELIDDSLYPDVPVDITAQYRELGSSARETMELLAHDVINSGTGTSTHTAGDGLAVFSGAHTLLRGGTWSNLISPAADLSATSLQTAITNFETTKDDSGKYQIIRPRYILVHPALEWKVKELLNSTYDPESSNNSVNTIQTRNLKPIISPYLTDQDAFTLVAEATEDSGIIVFMRRAVTFAKDGDFDTGDFKAKVTFRHSVEVNKPNNLYHSAGV